MRLINSNLISWISRYPVQLFCYFFSNTIALNIVPCGKLHLDRGCRLWGKSQEWILARWVSNSVGLGWWRSFICRLVPGLGLWVLSADKNQGQPRVCVFTAELFNLAHPRVYLVFSMLSASILNLFCLKLWISPFRVVCVCVWQRQKEKKDLNFFLLVNVHQKLQDMEKIFIKIEFIP